MAAREEPETLEREAAEWRTRARSLEHRGLLAEALEAYAQAVRLDPRDPGTYLRLGLVLRGAGRDDEANRAFQTALDLSTAG